MQTLLDASSQVFLANLGRSQRAVERAQRQITSGKRVSAPSDAPDQVESLLQLRAALDRNAKVKANLERASAEADVADQAVSLAGKLLDRAVTLASQAAFDTQTAATRRNAALEIASIQEQLVSITRTQVEGRYIFSGDDDQIPPYQIDPASSTGATPVSDAPATRRIEDPTGNTFASSITARDIFDTRNADGTPAAGNVLAALGTLRTVLQNGDAPGVLSALAQVRESSEHLSLRISFYGTLQNRIENGLDFASKYDLRLRTEMSAIEDADIASAALAVTQGNLRIEAALQARAQAPRTSLFDFLG